MAEKHIVRVETDFTQKGLDTLKREVSDLKRQIAEMQKQIGMANTKSLTSGISQAMNTTTQSTNKATMSTEELYAAISQLNRIRWGGLMGQQLLLKKLIELLGQLKTSVNAAFASSKLGESVGDINAALGDAGHAFETFRAVAKLTGQDAEWKFLGKLKNIAGGTRETFNNMMETTAEKGKLLGNKFADLGYGLADRMWKAFNKRQIKVDNDSWDLTNWMEDTLKNSFNTSFKDIRNMMRDALSYLGSSMKNAFKSLLSPETWKNFAKAGIESFKAIKEALHNFLSTAQVEIASFISLLAVVGMQIKEAFDTSKLGDDIDKTSQKLGMSYKSYQEWGFILERCGIQASTLKTVMRSLTQQVSSNSAAFAELGINIENMSREDILYNSITALQKYREEYGEVAAATKAQDIFGSRAFAEMMPLINQSNDDLNNLIRTYNALGYTMTDETASASAQLQDSITNLKYAFQGLKTSLSETFIPILQKIVEWLTVVVAKINIFVRTILGLAGKSTGGLEKAKKATGGIGAGISEAAEGAKELKRQLMGFDEINRLEDNKSSGSSGSGGGGFGGDYDTAGLESLSTLSEESIAKIEAFRQKMTKLGSTLRSLIPIVLESVGAIMAIVGVLTGNFPLALAGLAMMGVGFSIAKTNGTWEEGLDIIKDKFDKLGEAVSRGWEKTKEFFKKGWDKFCDGVGDIIDWIDDTKQKWDDFWHETVPKAVSEGWDAVKKWCSDKWQDICNWWNTDIAPIFTKEHWTEKFETIRQGFEGTTFYQKMQEKWDSVKSWFGTSIKPIFTTDYWKNKFNTIKQGIESSSIYQAITGVWDRIKSWFNNNVKPIFTYSYWSNKLQTIKNAFSDLNITFKTPHISWTYGAYEATGFLKKTLETLNLPTSLPKLNVSWYATGGITNGASIAGVGENGREAILPLENNTEWMYQLAKIINADRDGQNISVDVDGKNLFNIMVDRNNSMVNRTGRSPLKV